MHLLTEPEILHALQGLPSWGTNGSELEREFSFGDFREAMSFVNSVAAIAERAGHHPDIEVHYNKVRLVLSSHDAGGITERDTALAAEIAGLL